MGGDNHHGCDCEKLKDVNVVDYILASHLFVSTPICVIWKEGKVD